MDERGGIPFVFYPIIKFFAFLFWIGNKREKCTQIQSNNDLWKIHFNALKSSTDINGIRGNGVLCTKQNVKIKRKSKWLKTLPNMYYNLLKKRW